MRKQTPKLDWQVCEDEGAWHLAQAQPSPFLVRRTGQVLRRWCWWLGIALVILLPVLVEGYREVRRADEAMTRVEEEVRAAVAAEAWVRPHTAERAVVTAEGVAVPNPEIAQMMNTTPGTVAVTLSRTRDRLQKEYQAYMGGVA